MKDESYSHEGTNRLLEDKLPEWHMLELCREAYDPMINAGKLQIVAIFGTADGIQAVFYHKEYQQIYHCPIQPALDGHFIQNRRLYNGEVFCAKTGKTEKMLLLNNGPNPEKKKYNDWSCLCHGCKTTFRKIAHEDI